MDRRSRSTDRRRATSSALLVAGAAILLLAGCGSDGDGSQQEEFDGALQVEPETVDCSGDDPTVTFTVSVDDDQATPREVEQDQTYADPSEDQPVTDPDPPAPAPFALTTPEGDSPRTYEAAMPYDCAMGAIFYRVAVGDPIGGFGVGRTVTRAEPEVDVPPSDDPTAPTTAPGGTAPPTTGDPTTTAPATTTTMDTTTTTTEATTTTMPPADPVGPSGADQEA